MHIVKRYKAGQNTVAYEVESAGERRVVTKDDLITKYKRGLKLENARLVKGGFRGIAGCTIFTELCCVLRVTHKPGSPYIDALFDNYVPLSAFRLPDVQRMLYKIDKARVQDINTGCILTQFGITSISNLSSGCKTAVLAVYAQHSKMKLILSMQSAGGNATTEIFKYLFECVKKSEEQYVIPSLIHINGLESLKNFKQVLYKNVNTGSLGDLWTVVDEVNYIDS